MNSSLSSLIALDTETGGAGERQCRSHALLSVGLFAPSLVGAPALAWERHILPEPGFVVDAGAAAVNGYSEKEWENRRAVKEHRALAVLISTLYVVRQERGVSGKFTMLAHNAGHDRGFMECALERHGLLAAWEDLVHRRWECSMAAFAYAQRGGLVPGGEGCSLDALTAARQGITVEEARTRRGGHGALQDAALCWAGYAWLLDAATFAGSPNWLSFPPREVIPATGIQDGGFCAEAPMNDVPQRGAVPASACGGEFSEVGSAGASPHQ